MTNLDYLYDKDAAKEYFGKDYFVDKKLNFRIIERGTVLPHKHMHVNGKWTWGFGGLVDSKGEFVKTSFVRYGAGAAYTSTDTVQYIPRVAVYLGVFLSNWGHNITDNFRRLWFLAGEVFKTYFKDCPIVYVPWEGLGSFASLPNFKRLLEILDIDVNRLLPIHYPTQFENVILPDESYFFGANGKPTFFTNEYRETVDRVRNFALKNRTPTAEKKIYYFYGLRQVGEERIAEYFKSKGYSIVRPEKLTTDEQLNILINAESFASTLGACSHNSLFLRDGIETIFIPRAAKRFTTGRQDLIEQMRKSDSTYIDSSLSVFEQVNAMYCFIVSRQLKEFFGDKFDGYAEEDFKIFLVYLKIATIEKFKVKEAALQYYAPILQDFLVQLKAREDLLQAYGATIN